MEKDQSEYYKQKHSHDGYENQCKKCRSEYTKQLRKNDPKYHERHLEHAKRYRDSNIEKVKEANKKYREENRENAKKRTKEYYSNEINRKRKIEGNLRRKKERIKSDPLFNLSEKIRDVIRFSFKERKFKKNSKTQEILGCSFEEFKLHLESKFEPWMTWENRGLYNGCTNYGWDIDHIIPIVSAKTEEDVIRLNHYSNLQPLCSKINRDIKRDILEYDKCN